tara:strand:- start:64513 stop:64827 length:315 start_codon:yes stop_codon:yes gene_type:complete
MKNIKLLLKFIPKPLKNIYILSTIFFIFWILLIDDYNLLKQRKIQKKIDELTEQKKFYISEIKKDSIELIDLKTKKNKQEKFAREKFLMKKENEDLFIIRRKNE